MDTHLEHQKWLVWKIFGQCWGLWFGEEGGGTNCSSQCHCCTKYTDYKHSLCYVWLIDSLVGWLIRRLADSLTGWLTGLLAGWLTWLAYWLAVWLTGCVTDLTNSLPGWLTYWLVDWFTGWLTDSFTGWLNERWHRQLISLPKIISARLL